MSSADASAPGGEPALAPDDISDRTFPTAFRGFDPVEVRAFLGQVADELRAARQREAELRELIEAGGGAVAAAGAAPADDGAAQATLEEAEAAAAATRAKAEEQAGATVAAARDEADRLLRDAKERVSQLGHAATAESARVLDEARQQAQQLVRTKGEEAEGTAVKKIADAEREAASIRVKAREEADAILEAAKERGREMVAEAQAARERMIADLNKRKRAAAAQLDQLRAGRDRLLESLRVVRRNLDEITTRLEATEGVAPPVAATPDSPTVSIGSNPNAEPSQTPAVTKVPSAHPQEARRPARASRVVLGELPPSAPPRTSGPDTDAPASPAGDDRPAVVSVSSTPTPRIDAPQARAAAATEPPAPSSPPAPAAAAEDATSAPPEERKSSALRILRRRSGQRQDPRATPAQVGRDSPGEGIRIIGKEAESRPPAEPEVQPQPEPEPEREPEVEVEVVATDEVVVVDTPADVSESESESESDVEPAPMDEEDAAIDVDATDVVDVRDDAPPEIPDIDPEDLPPPLLPEEIRPRIEDLFARLRADREEAVAKAREVIGAPDGDDDHDDAEDGGTVEPSATSEAAATAGGPSSDEPSPAAGDNAGDGDEHLLQSRDVVVDPLVGQLTRRLKRTIQDEQNATLDRLRTSRPRPSADDVLASADTQPAPYRYAALPALEEAARAASAAAPFGAVGVGVDDLAQALAEEIASQIRSKVDRVLADAAEEDVDLQTASERVSSVYREWKTQRVERVASYHLVAAWSRGTFVATPEGTPMRWIVDDDGPCPDCDDNALAGPTPRGQAFPTGQLHPPAHAGCRCLLVALHG